MRFNYTGFYTHRSRINYIVVLVFKNIIDGKTRSYNRPGLYKMIIFKIYLKTW